MTSSELRDELVKAAGTHQRAAKVLGLLLRSTLLADPERLRILMAEMRHEIEAADGEPRDPQVGDSVFLRGVITELVPDLGAAFVRVYRTDPDDQRDWVVMQAGALEHDTAAVLFDGGVVADCPGDGCEGCADCRRPSTSPPEEARS